VTQLLVILIVVGAVLYLVILLPIDATIKRIIQVVAIVALAIWLIREFLPQAGLG
jgi:hypothetical protein